VLQDGRRTHHVELPGALRIEMPAMLTVFLFPFANFFEPGVFWPDLATYKPLQLIAIAALISSFGRKATYSRLDALTHPVIKFLLFYLAVQVASVYATGLSGVINEFGFWSTYALFAFVSLRIITSPEALRRYIWGMMLGSLWIIGWGIYGVFAGILAANGGRAGAYGMYENHNDYTFIIVQTLPFYYVYWRTETGWWRRSLLLAATLASIAGVFLSLSRGGMMALVLEVLLFVMFTMKPRTRLFMLPLVLAIGVGAVSYQYIARAANQGNDYTAEDAETSRLELWRAGEAMVLTHPLLGVGSRTFGEHAPSYAEISHDNLGKNAHNTFVETIATTGLLGLTAFCGMLIASIRELRKPVADIASDWERHTRVAILIALYTTCFRANFDAKTLDWSFYLLATLSAVSGAMMKRRRAADGAPAPSAAAPAAAEAESLPATNHLRR
jgi:O-antigen ligase